MQNRSLQKEAEACRKKALGYLGQPEAPFLLHLAREFDRLASEGTSSGRRKGDASGEKRRAG